MATQAEQRQDLNLEAIVDAHLGQHRELTLVALRATLEAIPNPAFVVDQRARTLFANDAGQRLLDRPNGDINVQLYQLVECAAQEERADPDAGAQVRPIRVEGLPLHYLVLLDAGPKQLRESIVAAQRRYSLTPRQTEVLTGICEGLSNKSLAERLGCSVRAVEQVVSTTIRKLGVNNRAAAAAKVLRG